MYVDETLFLAQCSYLPSRNCIDIPVIQYKFAIPGGCT